MTNKEYLFNIDDYELSEYLISISRYDQHNNEIYITPSGSEWFIYEDAIEATIEWLNSEVE